MNPAATEIAAALFGTDAGELLVTGSCRWFCAASAELERLGLWDHHGQVSDLGHDVLGDLQAGRRAAHDHRRGWPMRTIECPDEPCDFRLLPARARVDEAAITITIDGEDGPWTATLAEFRAIDSDSADDFIGLGLAPGDEGWLGGGAGPLVAVRRVT